MGAPNLADARRGRRLPRPDRALAVPSGIASETHSLDDVDPPETTPTSQLSTPSADADRDDLIGDADIESALPAFDIDPRRLLDRRVLNVVIGVLIAIAVATWPERSDRVLVVLIGIVLSVAFASSGWSAIRATPRSWGRFLIGVAGVVAGMFFIAFPGQSIVTVGRIAAVVVGVASCLDLARQFRLPKSERSWPWPMAKAFAGLANAVLLATYPTELLALVTAVVALVWAAIAAIALAHAIDRPDEADSTRSSGDLALEWLRNRPKDLEDREQLYEKVLYEGPRLRLRLARFFALMSFSSVIAAMGVITESTAVVIGAMLIAPLMTPLMGIAISIVMGWPNRLKRSATIALGGVLLSITIGIVLGRIAPTLINPLTNSQILSRSSPTTLDLVIAVAAGAAGAYGLSRPDVSDALPGVAIAISLVPPLSVVGISYSQGAWLEGNGALLLFITNALAIIVVGGLTFVLTGVTPIHRVAENQQRVRTASASVLALGALVVGALVINGDEITVNSFEKASVESALDSWADGEDRFDFGSVTITGDEVSIVVLGPLGADAPAEELHQIVVGELGRDVTVDVRLIIEEVERFPAD